MIAIGIDLPDGRHYDVVVGHDILQSLGERCRNLGLGDRCALITDVALTDNLATVAAVSLRAAGFEYVNLGASRCRCPCCRWHCRWRV